MLANTTRLANVNEKKSRLKRNKEPVKQERRDPYDFIHSWYPPEMLNDPEGYKKIIRLELEKFAGCKMHAWSRYSSEHMDTTLPAIDQAICDLATPIFGLGWPIFFSSFPDKPADGGCSDAIRVWVDSIMLMYVAPSFAPTVLQSSEELPWLEV